MALTHRSMSLVSLAALLLASACSFVLDFDQLEGEKPAGDGGGAGESSGGDGGTGGAGGTGGNTGGGGGTGGGAGGTGGAAGESSSGGSGGSGGGGTGGSGGGGTGGSGGGPAIIPLDEAAAAIADTLCAKLEECFSIPAVQALYGDEECRVTTESLLDNTMIAGIQASEDADTVTYDGGALPACLQAFGDLDCTEVNIDFPEECKQALDGLVGKDQDCRHSLECEPGLYCDISACPGTCREPLAAAASCGPTDRCEPGHTCFNGECVVLGDQGDPCGGDDFPKECLGGLFCVGEDETAGTPGECYPARNLFVLSEGQQCSFGDPPALCREELSCTVFTIPSACSAEAESGGACDLAVPDMCPTGEYCANGTCQPEAGPGENCVTTPCRAYLRCVGQGINHVCRPLSDNGEPCVENEECFSGYCPDTECAAPICL